MEAHEKAAQHHYDEIIARAPWLTGVTAEAIKLSHENASKKVKLAHFYALADRIANAVAPSALCAHGCHHCCHIAVSISSEEAKRIGNAIGVQPERFNEGSAEQTEEFIDRHFGEPCPFLADSGCAIYEHRPLECRLHFNIGSEAGYCDTKVNPEESCVPNLDLQGFWMAVAAACFSASAADHGDIRDYFPNGLRGAK